MRRDSIKHSFLRQITACVDWRGIRTLLNKKYTKTHNAIGNPAYDALMMFKILLLQTWYGLSDYEVEERINDSILFSEFLLLDIGLLSPDHSTISCFRTELTRLGIMDKLLRELSKQFKKHGISRIDQGAIVNASIVDSPYAPDGSIFIEVADDREDLRSEDEQTQGEANQQDALFVPLLVGAHFFCCLCVPRVLFVPTALIIHLNFDALALMHKAYKHSECEDYIIFVYVFKYIRYSLITCHID